MAASRSLLPASSAYYAYRLAFLAARNLPSPLANRGAHGVGVALAQAMRGRRWLVARHLRRVYGPGLTGQALRHEVQRAFDSYARYWLEAFRLPSLSPAQLEEGMNHQGLQHYLDARAAGRGVIFAIPHLGNWDFGGAWLAARGDHLLAVAEPLEPPQLFDWFVSFRQKLGLRVVPLGREAGTAALRALRAGETVALICDRNLGTGGVEVQFFGERTMLPGGPATLALRTGAPILPVAVYFEGRMGHLTFVRPPIAVRKSGHLRQDVTRTTQQIAIELEAIIRRAPEQWHLFQPNWPSDLTAQSGRYGRPW